MVLFAIGRYLCFALEGGPPCFLRDFSCPAVLRCRLYILRFRLPGFHRLWLFFPKDSANFFYRSDGPLPHKSFLLWFGLLPHSLAATWGISFDFFSSGYLDVSVHRVPGVWLCIHHTSTEGYSARFPHSDISGSKDICSSPKLFAAYHVFHRLLVPRHPPCALINLTK